MLGAALFGSEVGALGGTPLNARCARLAAQLAAASWKPLAIFSATARWARLAAHFVGARWARLAAHFARAMWACLAAHLSAAQFSSATWTRLVAHFRRRGGCAWRRVSRPRGEGAWRRTFQRRGGRDSQCNFVRWVFAPPSAVFGGKGCVLRRTFCGNVRALGRTCFLPRG